MVHCLLLCGGKGVCCDLAHLKVSLICQNAWWRGGATRCIGFEPFKPKRGEGLSRSTCWPRQQQRFLETMKLWLVLTQQNQAVSQGKEGSHWAVLGCFLTEHLDVFLSVCSPPGLGYIYKTTSEVAGLYKSLIVQVVFRFYRQGCVCKTSALQFLK